ncbi:hypothetical protein CEXT_51261, partial [Caerostris extrusa]
MKTTSRAQQCFIFSPNDGI